jgi:hypothetical protein
MGAEYQPILRAMREEGGYLFCSEQDEGWSIRLNGQAIASGNKDNASVEAGVQRFLGLITGAISPSRVSQRVEG